MSDTPETDTFFFRTDIEWDDEVNFSRKLERERDEARGTLREIASLQRYEHKFWDDGDGQIDESEREKADGMYLLHAQVSKILTRVLK